MSEHWVQTASGRRMDLVSPRAEDILLDDIAVGLSNLCRFTGQVRAGFYSVAQHSVHVAERVLALTGDVDLARCGLMHDAPEAYIHDLASPIKRLLPQYEVMESLMWLAVVERFGLPKALPPIVKEADAELLATEKRDLLAPEPAPWPPLPEPLETTIRPWAPVSALVFWLGLAEKMRVR